MPTRTREYSLLSPGSLVVAARDIYTAAGSATLPEYNIPPENRITQGTAGIIICGPKKGYRHHYQVQFMKNVLWWVEANEIRPYM